MFGLDPLSRPVAIAEILLLLSFAAFVGWLFGYLLLNGRVSGLRADIADKQAELDDCRQSKPVAVTTPVRMAPMSSPASADAVPPSASAFVVETAAYVPADPLLPAFSHDDTPNPITAAVAVPETEPVAGRPDNSEAAVLNRIAARAGEINFDRIGRATATQADDLKDIIGVGPFLERKLHSLGIYTFRQVANFTSEDMDTVNRIIEFFPGRIERDDWVGQSKAFHERKYGGREKTHD